MPYLYVAMSSFPLPEVVSIWLLSFVYIIFYLKKKGTPGTKKSRPSLINFGFKLITMAKKNWVPYASPIWSFWPGVGIVTVITIYFNGIYKISQSYLC